MVLGLDGRGMVGREGMIALLDGSVGSRFDRRLLNVQHRVVC
jgi:hypothetical protein